METQTTLLLEFQRLENEGEKLETLEYNEDIQRLLENIGERQTEILNLILLQ